MNNSNGISGRLGNAIAHLFPGYFALVMATGIVSIAAHLLGMPLVADILLVVNIAAYAVLGVMLLVRIIRYFPNVTADIADHVRGPGFFTVTAGTCVLGSQLVIVAGRPGPAVGLWYAGIVLWLVTMYSFFAAVTTRENKPTLEASLSGAWLIAAVATQSISVLGTLLADHWGGYRETVLFITLVMFLIGCMLYMLLIVLIFYRFTFVSITSERLTPPYWINMGAVAITTLAGARLIIAAHGSPLLEQFQPFVKGFTLFFWASGTWWIPLLFILGFWRHVIKRFPLRYDPQYWGLVFPLGMYTVCTFQLSKALDFEPLMLIPRFFVYLALVAWVAAAGGLLYTIAVPQKR